MSRFSYLLAAVSALVALGLGIVAWRQNLAIGRLERELVARRADGPARAARPAIRHVVAVAPEPLTRPALRDLAGPDGSGAGARNVLPSRHATRGVARLMEDPRFTRALSMHHEGMLDARFAELFRRLNLTPVELATFKRLLVERESVALDVLAIASERSDAPLTPAGLEASIRAARTQVEQSIRHALGAERFAIYDDYVRTLPQRAIVARLQQRLSYSDAPLTAAQAESLITILANHAPPAPSSSGSVVPVLASASTPEAAVLTPIAATTTRIADEALAAAQTVLSPPQAAAMRQIQVEIAATVEAAEMIREIAPAVGDRGPTGDLTDLLQFLLQ